MSRQKDVLGGSGALAELAGPLKDFFGKLSGEEGEQWFAGFKKFLRKENFWNSEVLRIDRTRPFDPVAFLGKGWKIVEEDKRALALVEVGISKIGLSHCLKKEEGENIIGGEERLKRLKALGRIRLDAKVFQALWENQKLIPESWKKKSLIYFDGTILLDPDGGRYALCLDWGADVWRWRCYWLEDGRDADRPSALLSPKP